MTPSIRSIKGEPMEHWLPKMARDYGRGLDDGFRNEGARDMIPEGVDFAACYRQGFDHGTNAREARTAEESTWRWTVWGRDLAATCMRICVVPRQGTQYEQRDAALKLAGELKSGGGWEAVWVRREKMEKMEPAKPARRHEQTDAPPASDTEGGGPR